MQKIHVVFFIGFAVLLSSCCNRPYSGGVLTWPQRKYNVGPDIESRVAIYSVQTGLCPSSESRDLKVSVTIKEKERPGNQKFDFRVSSKLGELKAKWEGISRIVLSNDNGIEFALLNRDAMGYWTAVHNRTIKE